MLSRLLLLLISILFISSCKSTIEEKPEPPSDWFYAQRAYPYGEVNPKNLIAAIKHKKEMSNSQLRSNDFSKPWEAVGPNNIGGRITDLEMWPDDQLTILAGSASGGVFRSNDAGFTWEPIFDDASSLSIGDIDISKSNPEVIYVGTGEANCGGGSLTYDGLGVYKSEDRGCTWQHLGLEMAGSIGKVAIDPTDHNTVYVAAMGRLFGNNSERGVYRSNDGGNQWEQVLTVNDSTGAIDLMINPNNPNIVYAATWERTRRPNNIVYGGAGSGIYKSEDGGNTWTELTNGLPNIPGLKGRIAMAMAPQNPDHIYAAYAAATGPMSGVFESNDGGNTWNDLPIAGIDEVGFQWWFLKLYVSPADEDQIFLTSFNMRKYNRDTENWDQIFIDAHVDHHAFYIHPQNPDFVINGNDGGIYISYDGGESYGKVDNLPNIQFYVGEVDANDPDRLLGGTQDNGTWLKFGPSVSDWFFLFGGDGFRPTVEPGNPDIVYVAAQNGFIARIENLANTSILQRDGDVRYNWNTPYVIDPYQTSTIFIGASNILKSFDRGENVFETSQDLTNGPYEGNRTFGTVTALDISTVSPGILYAGTDDGNVWNSSDGGITWNNINPPMSINRWTSSVIADPANPDKVYVVFSGYRYDSNDGHIYVSSDRGQNWQDITGDLPDIPMNDILVDYNNPENIFVATDIGVFYTQDNGSSWQVMGTDLPNVPVTDLDLGYDGTLIAATYGRSMFSYQLTGISSIETWADENVSIYPNPADTELIVSSNNHNSRYDYIIYSLSGQVVDAGSTHFNEALNIQNIKAGVYLLNMRSGSKINISKKIVIQ